MINRAIGTGAIFGALGGGLLGLMVGCWLTFWGGNSSDLNLQAGIMIPFTSALYGLWAGVVLAIPALIVGTIAGDVAGRHDPVRARRVGAIGTFVAAVCTAAIAMRGADFVPSAYVYGVSAALYGGLVAWLRLPWIYAGRWKATLTG